MIAHQIILFISINYNNDNLDYFQYGKQLNTVYCITLYILEYNSIAISQKKIKFNISHYKLIYFTIHIGKNGIKKR